MGEPLGADSHVLTKTLPKSAFNLNSPPRPRHFTLAHLMEKGVCDECKEHYCAECIMWG